MRRERADNSFNVVIRERERERSSAPDNGQLGGCGMFGTILYQHDIYINTLRPVILLTVPTL